MNIDDLKSVFTHTLGDIIRELEKIQNTDERSRETALVITKLEEAQHWLNHRTARGNHGGNR